MAETLPYRDNGSSGGGDEQPGDEEEDEIDETGYKQMKDAVLFAIDVSPSMLRAPSASGDDAADRKDGGDSPTAAALKCAYQLMQQRIITNPKDMMGILLFGTQRSRFVDDAPSSEGRREGAPPQYPHCYLLTDLDRPEAEDVKQLRALVEDEDEAAQLLVPADEPVAMANLLFCANQIFTTKAANFSSRRLFLVTDNDNPHPSNKVLRSSAAVRARDLYDLGVTIELFPISRPDHAFDRSVFYDDIVYQSEPTDPDAPAPVMSAAKASSSKDGLTLLQSLVSSVMSRNAMRRALFANMPFEISPDLTISINGYIILKRQVPAKSCWCFTAGEKSQIAEGSTVRSALDSGRSVEKPEIRLAYKFGGETVTFSQEEMSAIRTFGAPVLRIIGFKPLEMLPLWANMRESIFLFPTEEGVVGSTRTFSALYQSLLRKGRFALCWHIARKAAAPILCAVMPGEERTAKDGQLEGEQTMPAGLWMIKLPFADDIRRMPERPRHITAPDTLVDVMRQVMQQLQLPKAQFDPFKYPNPSLQWHYRVLQAMALDEDVPEKAADATVPKYRQIRKRAGPYVLEWGETLNEALGKWQKEQADDSGALKRPGTSSLAPPAKKQKIEKSLSISESDMRHRFEKQTISQLTVTVLKEFLKDRGFKVSSTAKKTELVEEVESFFESKQ